IGFGGGPYFIDRNISNIADQDELQTNQRREASFYGVHAVFIRLATILVVLCINIVFTQYNGWEEVVLTDVTTQQQLGLRSLMSIFPATALLIGIIFALIYPLNKQRVREIQQKRRDLKLSS
ncbi:MAG: MFS transporter, partial [Promethearchaeota archaeon]